MHNRGQQRKQKLPFNIVHIIIMVCLSHFGLIIHVSFQSRLYLVCVCGELALHTMCPFKAGYTWYVCMLNWPYTPCVLSKQLILGVCVVNWPSRPCVLSKQVILGVCGELALHTMCPFKAAYTWCVCVCVW